MAGDFFVDFAIFFRTVILKKPRTGVSESYF